MNPLLPQQPMGEDMDTVSMALQQRDEMHHAPDVPQVTDDMNPYFMETGMPPGHAMGANADSGPLGQSGGMGGMGGGGMDPMGGMGEMGAPGMEPGAEGMDMQSPDEAALMKDILMQRMQQQGADSEAYQGQAETQNQQSALQRKRMGV